MTLESEHYKPIIRHCTTREVSPDEPLLMIVGDQYFELTEEIGNRHDLLSIKRYLDGRHTLTDIAAKAGVTRESVESIVSSLAEFDLLGNPRPVETVSGAEFVKNIEDACRMWGQQIGFHHIFTGIAEGSLRSEVLLGLVLETYHYINSASKHIGVAVAHCDDDRLRPILCQHLADEWDHARSLVDGITHMGLPSAHLQTAHPLVGTISLVNNLCEIARQDTLSYIASTSLFEARSEDYEQAAADLRDAAERCGFPAESVEPLITHMRLDVEAGHAGLLAEAVEIIGDIPAGRAHQVVNNVHDIKHSLDQFHDQIVEFYSDPSNHIPRLKMDYFLL
ncbi:hypothetical protein [Amycolatopsis nivea]|uniref:hypothetical protein n=1 Tax=Amycolatopsis nivea TaxID=1644109 RepID=UPI0010704AC7|nr:hypothetical protein [Amycolatopsis nivea]